MDRHIAERWVQALRSGQYKQGTDALHPSADTYCCLGVLCDLYRVEQGKGEWTGDGCQECFVIGPDELEAAVLPKAVMGWADISTPNGNHYGHELSAMNDRGWSFDRLAEQIEKNWEVL